LEVSVAELASTVGRLTIVAESVPQPVAKITLPEFSHTVRAVADVGVTALPFTVTVNTVGVGLAQPDEFTQANEYENVPTVAAETEKETNVPEVAVVLAPMPTPFVELAVAVAPAELLPPGVTRQFELTISGDGPWQMATAPVPPPATAKLAGVPLTAVIEAKAGEGFTVTDKLAMAVLEQPELFTQAIV
jgi:hypothetical protein